MRRHVLVARLDNDGDVLLAGPAVRAAAAGALRVTLLCGPRGEQAAQLLPAVDELLVHRAPWIDPEPQPVDRATQLQLVDELARRRIDAAVILTSFHQSALPLAMLLRFAGVPFLAAISDDYPGSLLDVRHRIEGDPHEVERSLSVMEAAGFTLPPGDDGGLEIRRSASLPAGLHDRRYVVVHPGASVSARAWSPEHHAELVCELVAAGRTVVVTGAPAERELTARVAGPPRDGVLDLGGQTTLAQLAEVLLGADAVVVGNTGPAHLAAAVGTPVVSLFAPTVPPARWRPWRVPHRLLYVNVPCAGCRARTCPVPGHPCLEEITVEQVLGSLGQLAHEQPTREAVPA